MPRRTKQEAALTRNSLLKAALTVFSRSGYAAATLEDVAAEGGVTRGAIYWHFGSKAELYNALLDEYAGRSVPIIQQAAAEGGTLVEILRRVFIRLLVAIEDEPGLKEVMEISLFITERTPDLAPTLQQRLEGNHALLDSIAAVMAQGIASGELRGDLHPLDMARAFLGFQNGMTHLWLQEPAAFSLKACAPALAEIYLKGIQIR